MFNVKTVKNEQTYKIYLAVKNEQIYKIYIVLRMLHLRYPRYAPVYRPFFLLIKVTILSREAVDWFVL